MPDKLTIAVSKEVSKKTGNPYTMVTTCLDQTEISRVFVKPTEEAYYLSVAGTYEIVRVDD